MGQDNRLKNYKNAVLDLIELFDAFGIEAVPRELNSMADELAVAASAMQPCENLIKGESKLEIIFIPAVPDNIEHWQVFHDDSQIRNFLNNINEFAECDIDWKTEEDKDVEIVDLASNVIPRGVIPLERLFDRDDAYVKGKEPNKPKDYVEINIGSDCDPGIIKIGTNTSPQGRKEIETLVREYRDVFAWSYDDLKAYREDVIQHTIPLKEGAKPFKQKLRRINPKLAPLKNIGMLVFTGLYKVGIGFRIPTGSYLYGLYPSAYRGRGMSSPTSATSSSYSKWHISYNSISPIAKVGPSTLGLSIGDTSSSTICNPISEPIRMLPYP